MSLTLEEFIRRARELHGDKYDYSKTVYTKGRDKITATCPIHGDFEVLAESHISKTRPRGCKYCGWDSISKKKTLSQEEFIKRAREKYGDKFDYSKVKYVNMKTKVIITCPIHSDFEQTPDDHLRCKFGCERCATEHTISLLRKSTEEFIEQARKVHGDKYDYSKTVYISNDEKVIITCPIHGDFEQFAGNHLRGEGCKKCANEYVGLLNSSNRDEFIRKAREVHGDKYDYSKVIYKNNNTKVIITCPEHSDFEQTPSQHLRGAGCKYCIGRMVNNREEFIAKAREIHGDKYDYSKVEYINALTKVVIICPVHREFEQRPAEHLQGRGCPSCSASKLEKEMEQFLKDNKINYLHKVRKSKLPWIDTLEADFWLVDYDTIIECQGLQHFEPCNFGSTTRTKEECFEKVLINDARKRKLCEENNFNIVYYSNLDIDYPYFVYEDKDIMLSDIINNQINTKTSNNNI